MQTLEVSAPTVQRALTWLRDDCDSPVEFDRSHYRWILRDSSFTLPLSDPEPEDLGAVMFAETLLSPFADQETLSRIRRLVEQMDQEIREQKDKHSSAPIRPGALSATVTTASVHEPSVMPTLLRHLGRGVIEMDYLSPWSEDPRPRRHRLEPWQVRIHDGVTYLRGFSQHSQEARSFRVGQIVQIRALEGESPTVAMPPTKQIWGEQDPAFGMDFDRPDHAVLQIRGAVARWVHSQIWHPLQSDRWIEAGQLLERSLPYRSCRELARRLLSLGDAIVAIEPPALKLQVGDQARAIAQQLGRLDPPNT